MISLTELITKHNLNCYIEKNYRSSSGNIWNDKVIVVLAKHLQLRSISASFNFGHSFPLFSTNFSLPKIFRIHMFWYGSAIIPP